MYIIFLVEFYTVLLLCWTYKAMEWPSAWQPVNSISKDEHYQRYFVFEYLGFEKEKCQFWSWNWFLPVECSAICNWWWMCPYMKLYSLSVFILSKYCTKVMSPEETLENIHFLSTLIYINLLVFLIPFQPSNIRIYYCAIFINALFMLYIHCWIKSHFKHLDLMETAGGKKPLSYYL